MSLIKFKGANLITNGDFEVGDSPPSGWTLINQGGAASTVSSSVGGPYEGAYSGAVAITAPGVTPTDIQLKGAVADIPVISGMTYAVTMAATAAMVRDIAVQVLKGAPPWSPYGLNQIIALTPGWQEFPLDFTANTTAADGRLFLMLGGDANDVSLDIVSVHRKIDFTRNPVQGLPYKFLQPWVQAAGGTFFSVDKGVREEFIDLKWKSLPLADWIQLDDFIRNTAGGSANVFTYTDQDGVAHSVRFESIEVDFREARYQRYAGSIILRKVA